MPSNHNFVYFECRVNVRRSKLAEVSPVCPQCGHQCTNLGYKIRVPPKAELAAWDRLYADLREAKRRFVTTQQENKVALTHELERRLQLLELRAVNSGRRRTIRDLKKRLDELKQHPK